jgi:hypothetical protein
MPCKIEDFIHDDISLEQFVIPGLTKPALVCPVLDTGYLIRGNPVFSWIPAGVYPDANRGRNDEP